MFPLGRASVGFVRSPTGAAAHSLLSPTSRAVNSMQRLASGATITPVGLVGSSWPASFLPAFPCSGKTLIAC